jgi:hypothetical protein
VAEAGPGASRAAAPLEREAQGARVEKNVAFHRAAQAEAASAATAHEARADQLSFVRLGTFLSGAIGIAHGLATRAPISLAIGGALLFGFAVAVVLHARTLAARDRALVKKGVHERHLKRHRVDLSGLPFGHDLVPEGHVYAGDIDLTGEASLFSRLDVAHTRRGRQKLAAWLAAPAAEGVATERQAAVRELADGVALRVELEAAALDAIAAQVGEKVPPKVLDDAPFLDFVRLPAIVLGKPVALVVQTLPIATVVLWALSGSVLPPGAWLPTFVIQSLVAWRLEEGVRERHGLLVSRSRFVESYRALLGVAEGAKVEAPLLSSIQARLTASGKRPTAELSRLETWAGFFELRSQGLVHFFVNLFVLWDANVLLMIERWVASAGRNVEHWFEAIGELEALSSLSTLLALDPGASMPELAPESEGLVAEGLAHPLLPFDERIANDVTLEGPGTALLVTGSNMAGKSTLLRAVGQTIALALAGGPVIAKHAKVPPVRLRASMRIADSLQHGSSYFHAELARLRTVVKEAEASPPIFFLLDELLRGTNARARHLGARAVVLHLLARRATGMVATHDVALSELEEELGGKVKNVHFTDVFENGEMTFDYRLRQGVVKTSNALRLLQMAGIDVEADDKLTDD